MLDVITRRGDLELTLQIGAEILGSEDPRNRGDHPGKNAFSVCLTCCECEWLILTMVCLSWWSGWD